MSQSQLGEALAVSFQQLQKYERGTNRISASKLWTIAQVLNTPVSRFFPVSVGEGDNTLSNQALNVAVHIDALPPAQVEMVKQLVAALKGGAA